MEADATALGAGGLSERIAKPTAEPPPTPVAAREPEAQVRAQIPRATYRIQLNKSFTFRDATAIIPYLAELGISHVYCSPYFRARAGSTHGYDVVDHNTFNPEIGSPEEFEQFVAALRHHGMGHILDIVPNHVGIMGADNQWWMDVLENGQGSVYAEYFDIEWQPANPALHGKVLVPVLGDAYGNVLEHGELQLKFERELGSLAVFYHEHRLPVDPKTYPQVLRAAVRASGSTALEHLSVAFADLPDRHEPTEEQVTERHAGKEALKRRLYALCVNEPQVTQAIEDAVRGFTGKTGNTASFDPLHRLLEAQAYRLASWRVASDEINYRRFFDVNDLAALRVENLTVFQETHRLVLELVAAGKIDGLRIDHPDGLRDPAQYFQRLQAHVAAARATAAITATGIPGAAAARPATQRAMATTDFGTAGPHRELPIYLVAEKITASFEHIPPGWPVHGETGYHFANVVNRLLVDAATKARMDRVYQSFIEQTLEWQNVAYEAQHMILRRSLAAELNVVANQLARIAQADRHTRDFTLNSLRQTLAEVIACFPVYRTYVSESVSDTDRRYVDWAIATARRRRSAGEAPVFDFVRAALLLELPAGSDLQKRRLRDCAMKFQQVTAPVTAKGIEDTSLYRFNRLSSLNEVGGEPDAYGSSVRAYHADSQQRARFWPHEMLATSTHDTKRSEDVRARINVLSEMTQVWRKTIERWNRMNRIRKREVEGQQAPSLNDEYLLYQTFIGTWPLEELQDAALQEYRERIEGYMIKAAREAKARTSWANPNAEYEEALLQFIRAALELREGNFFLADLTAFQRRISRYGLYNALSQTLCKLTAPGVPDIYQGNDVWDFSLVDPDNRRPVDYTRRSALLSELQQADVSPAEVRALVENLHDGRAKLFLTWKALQYRATEDALFRDGEYLPLRVGGERAANVCAFARKCRNKLAMTIAPRLYLRLLGNRDVLPLGEVWEDTYIELPKGYSGELTLRNVLDGSVIRTQGSPHRLQLPVAQLLLSFPVALLALEAS
ncbi:MAG: malto-oligosyltrehalose synthase [Sinobacteraceae bacterium]|nr:malto-oligosyltrehalose synthase [Nevskiaceae bacterium]